MTRHFSFISLGLSILITMASSLGFSQTLSADSAAPTIEKRATSIVHQRRKCPGVVPVGLDVGEIDRYTKFNKYDILVGFAEAAQIAISTCQGAGGNHCAAEAPTIGACNFGTWNCRHCNFHATSIGEYTK